MPSKSGRSRQGPQLERTHRLPASTLYVQSSARGSLGRLLVRRRTRRGAPATATPGVAPNRQAPIDRPPSAIGRRPPVDDDGDQPPSFLDRRRRPAEATAAAGRRAAGAGRPQEAVRPEASRPEASRPPEREAPAKRKPAEKPERPRCDCPYRPASACGCTRCTARR